MNRTIFNRTEIVRDLSSRCFGADGKSVALVCAQMVGKSKVLDYLTDKYSGVRKVVVCKVNLDLLRGSLEVGQEVSDKSFFQYFLGKLEDELTNWIDQSKAWEDEIQNELEGLANVTHTLQQGRKQQLIQELMSLAKLPEVHAKVSELVKSQRPIIPKLLKILRALKRVDWQVVLVIDDFQRMLAENAFTDRLYFFLRGANSEKQIVSIVASTTGLMEESLHRGTKNRERKTLFNHFYHSQLRPFDEAKAMEFLDWLTVREREEVGQERLLVEEQKRYLYKVAGGTPFFLERARGQFLTANMPASKEERLLFEKNTLLPAFKPAFEMLWSRCTAAQRELLQEIATGRVAPSTVVLDSLEQEGFLRIENDRPHFFARIFTDFVIEKRPVGGASKQLKIYFLAANPLDQTRLELGKEKDTIEDVLSRSRLNKQIEVKDRMETRPECLLELFSREKPQLVHFSSHGGGGLLLLVNEYGNSAPIDTQQIDTLFSAAGGAIQVVVFNACHSVEQADAIVRHVDCVVGMKEEVFDDTAHVFSKLFYTAIGEGRSVKEAFDKGHAQVAILRPGEESNLVLTPRRGVNPAELFLLTEDGGK